MLGGSNGSSKVREVVAVSVSVPYTPFFPYKLYYLFLATNVKSEAKIKIFSAHKSRQYFLVHSRTQTHTRTGLVTSRARVGHKNKALESAG